MTVLGLPEQVDVALQLQEHLEDGRAAQLVAAVGSPGSDYPVGPNRLLEQVAVVVFPDGIRVVVERPGIG